MSDKTRTVTNLIADAAEAAAKDDHASGIDAMEIHVRFFRKYYQINLAHFKLVSDNEQGDDGE